MAYLLQQEPIGYINVNNGDVYQDIHPKSDLYNSQSQKALNSIHFHKDLANHFVRPDWVNMIALRNSNINRVYTNVVRNKDILKCIDNDTIKILSECKFYTPYDDLSEYKPTQQKELGRANNHPVINKNDIRFFEKRTLGLDEKSQKALKILIDTIHKVKIKIMLQDGDFMSINNNLTLHEKEIECVNDELLLYHRWIIKTVNVNNLAKHQKFMKKGTNNIVNG